MLEFNNHVVRHEAGLNSKSNITYICGMDFETVVVGKM